MNEPSSHEPTPLRTWCLSNRVRLQSPLLSATVSVGQVGRGLRSVCAACEFGGWPLLASRR
jgi:hypothetical protein